MTPELAGTIIITGHYGSGKTNLALNLALDLRSRGEEVTLADLDVVNPYFRTADFSEIASLNGINLLASDYANSNIDIPALSGALDAKLASDGRLIIDVGGDDAGARALGRYAGRIAARPYTMIYVVNAYRYLMKDPRDCAALLRDIEAASRIRATHIVNCSNLGVETTARDIENSLPYAQEVARLSGLPLLFTAARRGLFPDGYPVEIYVKTPWQ